MLINSILMVIPRNHFIVCLLGVRRKTYCLVAASGTRAVNIPHYPKRRKTPNRAISLAARYCCDKIGVAGGSVGIGRRARLRILCRKASGFKSLLPHHFRVQPDARTPRSLPLHGRTRGVYATNYQLRVAGPAVLGLAAPLLVGGALQ